MTFANGASAHADDQFTADFFRKNGVRLSVEAVAANGRSPGHNPGDRGPNFFFWVYEGALHLVDFGDGFSRPLHECLDAAIAIVRDSGVSPDSKPIYWRNAAKEWHCYDNAHSSSPASREKTLPELPALGGC